MEYRLSKVATDWKLRRKFGRYRAEGRFVITLEDGSKLNGWLRDIGEGGFGGILSASLGISQKVSVILEFGNAGSLKTEADVRWYNGVNFGFEFLTLTAQQRAIIVKLCSALEMAE